MAKSLRYLGIVLWGECARDYRRRCPGVVKTSEISFFSPGRGPKFSWVVKIIATECRFLFYIGFDVFILLLFFLRPFYVHERKKKTTNNRKQILLAVIFQKTLSYYCAEHGSRKCLTFTMPHTHTQTNLYNISVRF